MSYFRRWLGKKSFVQPSFWDLEAAGFPLQSVLQQGHEEQIGNDFDAYVQGAYKQSGVIFACIQARQLAFSEARFAACKYDKDGRPGPLKYTPGVELLQYPWPGGCIGDLLSRMELDVSLAGNFYATLVDDLGNTGLRARARNHESLRVMRLRPDWVTILIGSKHDPEGAHPYDVTTKVLGYDYNPPMSEYDKRNVLKSPDEHDRALFLNAEDVAHYAPIPDPAMRARGMSWLTPTLQEIKADKSATKHKLKFFEMGASPKVAIALDKEVPPEDFERFAEMFKDQHQGVDNAYKTLFLAGGANVSTVGADLRQLDFKITQGAGETRIAAASGVPPVIVGLSEGLQSATYSNYGQARRRFADNTIRPLWRSAADALAPLVELGDDEHLRVDDRDIAFLREDLMDQAQILEKQAVMIRQLVDGGFDPDAAVAAASKYDIQELRGEHTGLMSVQLLPPGLGTISPDGEIQPGQGMPGQPGGVAGGPAANGISSGGTPKPGASSGSPSGGTPKSPGVKRDFSADERRESADRGHALPDGSYPIENEEDLRNAIGLAGHGNAGKAKIRAHIRKRARALGRSDLIPDEWGDDE